MRIRVSLIPWLPEVEDAKKRLEALKWENSVDNLFPDCDILMSKEEDIPRALFWDTDPTRLDLQENKEYIIERTLELGDDRAVRWLFSNFSRSDINKVLAESKRIS